MNTIRAKITPAVHDNGNIHLRIEWVPVATNEAGQVEIGEPLGKEEMILTPKRHGCAYVSSAAFESGVMLPSTFLLAPDGSKHYFAHLEAGHVAMLGAASELAKV